MNLRLAQEERLQLDRLGELGKNELKRIGYSWRKEGRIADLTTQKGAQPLQPLLDVLADIHRNNR
jgi:hypothetical protein